MKKIYTITRKLMTNDPECISEQRNDRWSIMYERLSDANRVLVREANEEYDEIKHRFKNAYKSFALAGKTKVAIVGFKEKEYYYETNFIIDQCYFMPAKDKKP